MLIPVFIFIFVAVVTAVYLFIRKRLFYWQRLGVECEEPHFLMGNLKGVQSERGFHEIWQQYYDKFKGSRLPFVGFYWFLKPAVFVLDPQLIKNILRTDFKDFTDRGFFSNEKDDPLSGQLFLLDGLKWSNMRNKLTPTFTSGKMKFMFNSVVKVGEEFIEVLDKMVADDNVVEFKDLLARFTTDVIGTCAFGIQCNSLKNPNAEFLVMGRKSLTEQKHNRLIMAFASSFMGLARKLRIKQTTDEVEEFFLRIVRETVEYREKNKVQINDFMNTLMDLKNKRLIKKQHGSDLTNLTLEEIAAQAFVIFTGGYETSSTGMAFVLYELALNEEVQERARHEVLQLLENYHHKLTYNCVNDMVYLYQVISETLRLHPVLPVINRCCLNDYVVPGHPNLVIKKGMPIIIPSGAIHRDENYYPNPDKFNPDNFSKERMEERQSVLWLAFGDGPRNCIGMRFARMQALICLALLLKNFRFSICGLTEVPLPLSKQCYMLSLENGVYLEVTRIEED